MADPPTSASPRRTPLAEQAYQQFKERILRNRWPAGFQALEQSLAEELGMSRTPVREALLRLANEGLVEVRPRHGMRVLPVSVDDMRQIYEVLTALESKAAELAARRGLSAAELGQLDGAVMAMEEALRRDDLFSWAEGDRHFHLRLTGLCGNPRLDALVANYWDQSHRVRLLTLELRPRPINSNVDHAAVVRAIAKGDATTAREIHRRHRERSGEMLIEILQRIPLR